MLSYLSGRNRTKYERYVLPGQGEDSPKLRTVDVGGQLLLAHEEHGILAGRGGSESGVIEDEGPSYGAISARHICGKGILRSGGASYMAAEGNRIA